jgi:hypothetical protein
MCDSRHLLSRFVNSRIFKFKLGGVETVLETVENLQTIDENQLPELPISSSRQLLLRGHLLHMIINP